MAHETVPPDIAAAINALVHATQGGTEHGAGSRLVAFSDDLQRVPEARAALDAAILKHLHGYAEMKAALEAQTSGA